MSGTLSATPKCCTASLQFSCDLFSLFNDRKFQGLGFGLETRGKDVLGVGLKGPEHVSVPGQFRVQVAKFAP
jgi:hypothetical protein